MTNCQHQFPCIPSQSTRPKGLLTPPIKTCIINLHMQDARYGTEDGTHFQAIPVGGDRALPIPGIRRNMSSRYLRTLSPHFVTSNQAVSTIPCLHTSPYLHPLIHEPVTWEVTLAHRNSQEWSSLEHVTSRALPEVLLNLSPLPISRISRESLPRRPLHHESLQFHAHNEVLARSLHPPSAVARQALQACGLVVRQRQRLPPDGSQVCDSFLPLPSLATPNLRYRVEIHVQLASEGIRWGGRGMGEEFIADRWSQLIQIR